MKNAFKKVLGSIAGLIFGVAVVYVIVVCIVALITGAGFVPTILASGTWLSKLGQK